MIKNFWKRVVASQERRAAFHQLRNLSDRQLSDIGVSRAEIKARVFSTSFL
jgi:uncharacterized protein YjiS (DUF1127 family)